MASTTQLVIGTILSVQVEAGPGTIPATRATLRTDDGALMEFLLPGANGGPPAAVLGVPVVQPGQRWEIELGEALIGPVPVGHGAGMRSLDPQPVWNLNGNHLPDDLLPWPFLMHEQGLEALGADTSEAIVEASLAQWSGVPCSTFAFAYQGRTGAGVEDDGLNVIAWESDTWEWHAQAAAMSVVRFDLEGDYPTIRETDILFNAVAFDWSADTGSTAQAPPLLHAGSVLTHELGHSTGMDHEYFYVSSTMYLAYFGGSWGATLSGDDMRGLCENYPSGLDACTTDEDCEGLDASERECEDLDGIMICDEVRDPVGAACQLDAFDCEEVCLFDTMFYADGTCVLTCPDGTCEPGFTCLEASYTVPLDAGPVCVPDQPDTGLDTADTASDSPAPDDTDDSEPEGCGGCTSAPASPLFTLPFLLGLARRRPFPTHRSNP